MKKIASLLLTVVTVAALAGCGNTNVSSNDGNSFEGHGSSSSANASVGYPNENGYAEGYLNDAMHSCFFDFTVKSAYLCDEYDAYVADDGYKFLVADITIKNTTASPITMFDVDFMIHWDDESEDSLDFPITYYLKSTETINDEILPAEYDLASKETRSGLLVFTVPTGCENNPFAISYLEEFDDDTEGDIFFVWFVPESK